MDEQLNDDGLVPGQPVDFDTVQRVNRERLQRKVEEAEHEPAKKIRKPRQQVVQNPLPSNDE